VVRYFVHEGMVALKSHLTVVKIHVAAKISMLRLNIASGMLRLSSCMLSIGHGPYCAEGCGGGPSGPMANTELSKPEPIFSISMLILAKYPVAALEVTSRSQNNNYHTQISTCRLWVTWCDVDRVWIGVGSFGPNVPHNLGPNTFQTFPKFQTRHCSSTTQSQA